MKKYNSILALLLAFLLTATWVSAQDRHLGHWQGEDQSEVGYMILDKEGFAAFIIEGDTLGGPSFVLEGLEAFMTYEIDYAAEPFTIDFILSTSEDGAELGRLPGIFEFPERNQMHLCVNFGGQERPTTFVEEDSIVFERVDKSKKKE